jgi:secondary thiamine-phosphate synthase enzyme
MDSENAMVQSGSRAAVRPGLGPAEDGAGTLADCQLLNSATGAEVKANTYSIQVTTTRSPEFVDITQRVVDLVRRSQVSCGFAVVFSRHTTAAIRINENEPLLLQDWERFLERMASRDAYYRHNDFTIRTANMTEDECPNGHAHCQHLALGTSETIPIAGGQLQIGRWQRVFLVELDRARQREVLVQVLGI